MLLWLALLLQPPGYEGPPLTHGAEAASSAAAATATMQGAYIACGRVADAARVERDYLQLGAEARAQAPDHERYLRLWQRQSQEADGSWPAGPCDDWARDQGERMLEAAIADFRALVHPEPARRSQMIVRSAAPEEGHRLALWNAVLEADLFARGAVARAMAEDMRCGRAAEAEAVESRLLAIERTVPGALYEDRSFADFKYGAGQSRDGSWPRPPTLRCLAEERRALDGDVEEYLRDLGAAARAYLDSAH
jgi:hypothetical protein